MTYNNLDSIVPLLAAKSKTVQVRTMAPIEEKVIKEYQDLAANLAVNLSVNSTMDNLQPTELLYIDTPAEGNFRFSELNKFNKLVSKFIILPNTNKNGLQAAKNVQLENNQNPIGLNFGINYFIINNEDWYILEHDDIDPGITVLYNKRNVTNA
jgi:hypothetical protein